MRLNASRTRMAASLLFFLLLAPPGVPGEPVPGPSIILPTNPIPPTPPPVVTPVVGLDQLYVVRSKEACTVLASPDGIVKIQTDAGPVKIHAKLWPLTTYTCPTYKEPFVYIIQPVVSGNCELLIVSGTTTIRQPLVVGTPTPPKPPDPPTPPTPPDPPQPAPPFPASGLHTLILYETGDLSKYPAGQSLVLYSEAVRDAMAKGPDGRNGYRIWDYDADPTNEAKVWQDAMKAKPTGKDKLPWVIISNGKTGYSGPLPATVAEMQTLMAHYGGG